MRTPKRKERKKNKKRKREKEKKIGQRKRKDIFRQKKSQTAFQGQLKKEFGQRESLKWRFSFFTNF